MANQYGLFWNSVSGDRTYDADSFAEWANTFFSTGVFNGDLQVTPTAGMVVNVGTGYANVNGKIRLFEADTTFTLSPASGTYPRVDTIVVRRDEGARQISLAYVMGAYSGLNPVPTPPARDGGIYELVLAQITVGAGATAITVADITDTRADSDLCGWITGSVDSVDVDQLTQQAQAQFMTWFDHMKDQLDEDAAGHLQMEIDTLSDALEAHDIDLGIRETGTTAAQMHRAGQYFMLDHRFCIATQNIAEGDTLEHLVNYNYANIGDELYELKSGLTNLKIAYDLGRMSSSANFETALKAFADSIEDFGVVPISVVIATASGVFLATNYIGHLYKLSGSRYWVILYAGADTDIVSGRYNSGTYYWKKIAFVS